MRQASSSKMRQTRYSGTKFKLSSTHALSAFVPRSASHTPGLSQVALPRVSCGHGRRGAGYFARMVPMSGFVKQSEMFSSCAMVRTSRIASAATQCPSARLYHWRTCPIAVFEAAERTVSTNTWADGSYQRKLWCDGFHGLRWWCWYRALAAVVKTLDNRRQPGSFSIH